MRLRTPTAYDAFNSTKFKIAGFVGKTMTEHDWFRNSEWNEDVEANFFAKLHRARDKSQYLRIQANTLAQKYPAVALRLLNQYFDLGEHFDQAQAYVDRATAHLALGDVEQALCSYEAAISREAVYPQVKTGAYLYFSFLVATQHLNSRYDQSLRLLSKNKSALTFPVDYFRWCAAAALILADLGEVIEAKHHAKQALEAASQKHSGFRYHPNIGLVGEEYESVYNQLRSIQK